MTKQLPDVTISTTIDRDASLPDSGLLRGGLRVTVDETVLTRYDDSSDGEFVGEYPLRDLGNILDCLTAVASGECGTYETVTARIEAYDEYLLFEPLGDAVIRLAFRTHAEADDRRRPPPESAVGVAVGVAALSEAVLEAARDLLAGPLAGHDAVRPEAEVLEEKLVALERQRQA